MISPLKWEKIRSANYTYLACIPQTWLYSNCIICIPAVYLLTSYWMVTYVWSGNPDLCKHGSARKPHDLHCMGWMLTLISSRNISHWSHHLTCWSLLKISLKIVQSHGVHHCSTYHSLHTPWWQEIIPMFLIPNVGCSMLHLLWHSVVQFTQTLCQEMFYVWWWRSCDRKLDLLSLWRSIHCRLEPMNSIAGYD